MSLSVKLKLAIFVSSVVAFQTACQFPSGAHAAKKLLQSKSQTQSPPKATKALASKQTPEALAYEALIAKHWANDDFEWLDKEAARLRISKDRLPGGFWKLRALFRTLENPHVQNEITNADWEAHIAKLERWAKTKPTSITPQVLLVDSWENFAWKARGTGFSNTVTDEGWKLFSTRTDKAEQLLNESSRLSEKCPEWYLAALTLARSQGWEREDMEQIFAEGTALEPTYYYLHQAKAGYLLPRWYGEEGEWERFAEQAANQIGGEQGDVVFFTIYSNMMSYHNLDFMNTHQQNARRLMSGFRAIEKLYGPSPLRLNEAALISFFAGDPQTSAELMKRIGDDFDESVWRSKTNFDVFKQGAMKMSQAANEKQKIQATGSN